MNNITINNDTNSITITKANNQILTLIKDNPIPLNIVDVGLQGIRGAKGDKGDTFAYSDLTEEQKQDFASRIEIDTSTLNTDLQSIYILNKE